MNVRLIADISLSLLLARWRQTLVAAVGVMFSITMFVGLLGFMSGLNGLLDGLIINRTPHVHLYNEIEPEQNQPVTMMHSVQTAHHFIRSLRPKNERPEIHNNGAVIRAISQDKRVLGVAPKVTTQVFYTLGYTNLPGMINGIDPVSENKLFAFSDYVVAGSYLDLKNTPNSIILGKAAAEKMMADVGDVIQITTVKGQLVPLKVVGFFQSGLQEIDKVQSYCTIETTQKLLGESSSYVTDIQVKLKDINQAPTVAAEYRRVFDVEAMDVQTANAQFETGSFIRSLISYAVGITLLIVAGFGIYNILNMMIYEKMDSIAILKATGFSGKDVNRIFILIALSIGIFGGAFGLVFGYGLSEVIDHIPFNTPALPTIKTYPVNYDLRIYMIGGSFSLITTYLAGYFPSRKASRIDPVIIIRGK